MSYALGFQLLKAMCVAQSPMDWHNAKLPAEFFQGPEVPVFNWVDDHVRKYRMLPKPDTLASAWPVLQAVTAIEPSSYYLEKLENAWAYRVINQANIDSQTVLKQNQDDHQQALEILDLARKRIVLQKQRTQLLDFGQQGAQLVVNEYHGIGKSDKICWFGWQYMDAKSGGIVPGDLVSFIGRPAQGKTWMMLYIALHNWVQYGRTVLFVSMEMNPLAISQRAAAMYTQTPYGQLKAAQMSTPTYSQFSQSLSGLQGHKAKFWVVDGNLAVNVDEIYALADMLNVDAIVIDGAYMVRHRNSRLNRFERVAENVEQMKADTSSLKLPTFASWQFSRSAVKGDKKGKEEPGLEDIGSSDTIGQSSSIVLAMDQEDSIETLVQRQIRVMKGRSGELGRFPINWWFDTMDFTQYVAPEKAQAMAYV